MSTHVKLACGHWSLALAGEGEAGSFERVAWYGESTYLTLSVSPASELFEAFRRALFYCLPGLDFGAFRFSWQKNGLTHWPSLKASLGLDFQFQLRIVWASSFIDHAIQSPSEARGLTDGLCSPGWRSRSGLPLKIRYHCQELRKELEPPVALRCL